MCGEEEDDDDEEERSCQETRKSMVLLRWNLAESMSVHFTVYSVQSFSDTSIDNES